MSATFLSFSDWREALHADQLARIDRIGMESLGIDPKGIIREYLDAVRKDSYNNPSEAEYYIKQVEAQLKREREWASEAAVRESIRG